jgi:hypothetical protein
MGSSGAEDGGENRWLNLVLTWRSQYWEWESCSRHFSKIYSHVQGFPSQLGYGAMSGSLLLQGANGGRAGDGGGAGGAGGAHGPLKYPAHVAWQIEDMRPDGADPYGLNMWPSVSEMSRSQYSAADADPRQCCRINEHVHPPPGVLSPHHHCMLLVAMSGSMSEHGANGGSAGLGGGAGGAGGAQLPVWKPAHVPGHSMEMGAFPYASFTSFQPLAQRWLMLSLIGRSQ